MITTILIPAVRITTLILKRIIALTLKSVGIIEQLSEMFIEFNQIQTND